MYVRFMVGRAKSPADALEIRRLFRLSLRLRQEAEHIQGECLISLDDHRSIVIEQRWGNLAGLEHWIASEESRTLREQTAPLLETGVWVVCDYEGW